MRPKITDTPQKEASGGTEVASTFNPFAPIIIYSPYLRTGRFKIDSVPEIFEKIHGREMDAEELEYFLTIK